MSVSFIVRSRIKFEGAYIAAGGVVFVTRQRTRPAALILGGAGRFGVTRKSKGRTGIDSLAAPFQCMGTRDTAIACQRLQFRINSKEVINGVARLTPSTSNCSPVGTDWKVTLAVCGFICRLAVLCAPPESVAMSLISR